MPQIRSWSHGIAVAIFFLSPVQAEEDDKISYNKHIRLIFNAKCTKCHGGAKAYAQPVEAAAPALQQKNWAIREKRGGTEMKFIGLKHNKLTYPFNGLDQTLPGVTKPARLVKEIFA